MIPLLIIASFAPCMPDDGLPDNRCIQAALDANPNVTLECAPGTGAWEIGPPQPGDRNRWAAIIVEGGGIRGCHFRMTGNSGGHDWMMVWLTGYATLEDMHLDGRGRYGTAVEQTHTVLVSGRGNILRRNLFSHPDIGIPGGDCVVVTNATETLVEDSVASCDRSFLLIQKNAPGLTIRRATIQGGDDQVIDHEASDRDLQTEPPGRILIEGLRAVRDPANGTAALTLGPGRDFVVRDSDFDGPILLGDANEVLLENVTARCAGAKRAVYQMRGGVVIRGGRYTCRGSNAVIVSRLGVLAIDRAHIEMATPGQGVRCEAALCGVRDSLLVYTGAPHRDAIAVHLDVRGGSVFSATSEGSWLWGPWTSSGSAAVTETALLWGGR